VQSAQILREAIYALATGEGGPKERATLNAMASSPPATPRLDDDGAVHLKGDAQGLLATVAREAIFLFGGPARAHVRQCEGDGCAILFLDTSRKGTRRWCSMKACGNKAKVAQFRQRQRSKPD
jgi:predicted RNA-binding Zn ribbon-like protein